MYVKPPTIIYCYYSLYTHYIPIILIIIKPPNRVSLLTYPWYSHCTPMIAAQISSVGYLSMNHGSWKITHIGTTIIKEKWFSTILTDVHFSIFLEVTIYTYTCVYIYILHIYTNLSVNVQLLEAEGTRIAEENSESFINCSCTRRGHHVKVIPTK